MNRLLNVWFIATIALLALGTTNQLTSVVAQNSSFGTTTPVYVATNGTVTSTRVINVSTDHPQREVSFTEDAIINNVGNVTNIGTFISPP
jgi:hypothetical protein